MRSKNACKTCALGMGGQLGGMVNEDRRFPEVCKKSLQAMAADMRGKIDPKFFETYSLAQLAELTPRELEALGRITQPLRADPGATHFRTVSWNDALDYIAATLKRTAPMRSFFYSSGRSSNEAGFVLHLLARCYGTNHVNNCSFYCHQASGVGLGESIGTGTGTVNFDDVEKCDLVFLIGANPSSNHPRLLTQLANLRKRGGNVIVVNPAKEIGLQNFKVPSSVRSMLFGSEIATKYIQPTIGGDIGFLAGVSKCILDRGLEDSDYIASTTDGFEALIDYVHNLSWQEIEDASGVLRSDIDEVASLYARSKGTIFAWSMGITHHQHGVENVQWIANLALLRGMIGKPGAGVMPIRGHSNVQGLGTIGVTPEMKNAAIQRMEALGIRLPDFKGHDTLGAMEASDRGEIDTCVCLGGNLFGATPDAAFANRAIANLDTIAYLSTSMNTGHVHGRAKTTFILPVRARDEEDQSTTQESMFNYVRLSDGGPERYEGPRSEVEVLTEIARRTLGDDGQLDWEKLKNHDDIRALIAKLVPNMESIKDIGRTKKEFHVPDRILHEQRFNTATARALFKAHPIPKLPSLGDQQLRLMTARSEGQFNTVVYEDYDLYRGQDRRDVILMNRYDIHRLGFREDQAITVASAVGEMHNILVREFDIARGCAMMYYPEANILIPRDHDSRSKTPAFKSVVVSLRCLDPSH
jgi:molybdopterin-dependent oxidoreductase alpha subunit